MVNNSLTLEWNLDDGAPRNTALARLGLVTRARMTQIMNLLNLAPDIQEEILFLAERTQRRETFVGAGSHAQ